MPKEKYTNRQQAGMHLALYLSSYFNEPNTIILALPRGGVPIAYELSQALLIPMDIYIVRKLGAPSQEEYAIGALAEDNTILLNKEMIQLLQINSEAIQTVIDHEKKELLRREQQYRMHPLTSLTNKIVILVDDGLATGLTMKAAVTAIKKQSPHKIIIAVPVAARSTCEALALIADEVICPLQPINFQAVGKWYEDFTQVTDEAVIAMLKDAEKKIFQVNEKK